ncbi:MAG: DUF1836 domain-containing protein [Eubacteriales bacterium]|nr:DUF1836 domain-containing protein [Eubacteriales bacterium]
MNFDRAFVTAKLRKWEHVMGTLSLPSWEMLPPFDLYMDQVISLLKQYLSFFPEELGGEKFITQSAINNYVRLKIIPPPVKKRYTRYHLAYLIIICCLKPTLSISYIQKMIPLELDEEQMSRFYNNFVDMFRNSTQAFIGQISTAAAHVLDPQDGSQAAISTFVCTTALTAGLSKLLTEKLLNIQNESDLSKI